MTQDEIIEMAQECGLVGMRPHLDGIYVESLIAFAKLVEDKALAQPEQEPVAWMDADGNVSDNNDHKCFPIPLFTTPPQRTWVDVPDEEIKRLWIQYRAALPRYLCFAKALLARVKEKNT